MNKNLYFEQLESLYSCTMEMSVKVKKMMEESIYALIKSDKEKAQDIIIRDDEIDQYEREINEKSIKLIALQQPMAKDLREIFGITKIARDLERIGDLSVNLSRIAQRCGKGAFERYKDDLIFLCDVLDEMIDRAVEAYYSKDANMARIISEADEEVDTVYKDVSDRILSRLSCGTENIKDENRVLFAFKYIERIGDHITNICETTIFTQVGKMVQLNN